MNEPIDRYADIIRRPHHRSSVRMPMPRAERAAQFSAFAALTGHGDAIRETARVTETKPELSETAKAEIDAALRLLALRPLPAGVCLVYYEPDARKPGGTCHTIAASVRKLTPTHLILADARAIPLAALLALDLSEEE